MRYLAILLVLIPIVTFAADGQAPGEVPHGQAPGEVPVGKASGEGLASPLGCCFYQDEKGLFCYQRINIEECKLFAVQGNFKFVEFKPNTDCNEAACYNRKTADERLEDIQATILREHNIRFPKRIIFDGFGRNDSIFFGSVFIACFLLGLLIYWKARYFSVYMNLLLSSYITSGVLLYKEWWGHFNYYFVINDVIFSSSHILYVLLGLTVADILLTIGWHITMFKKGIITPLVYKLILLSEKTRL